MADLKISELTDGGNLQDTDQLVVNRGGANRRVTSNNLNQNQIAFGNALNKKTSSSNLTWDDTNKRLAAGTTNTISADNAVALGENNTASQTGAMAVNGENIASGFYSFSGGFANHSTGDQSISFGVNTQATGTNSFAIGDKPVASGRNSIATGFLSVASGENSLTLGENSQAKGKNSLASGIDTISTYSMLALGRYNVEEGNLLSWVATDPALIIGNGTSNAARSNALKILKNGNIETIGTIKARLEIVQVTALTKSLILSDANTEQEMSNAAAQTLTVEPDSTTNFPIGTRITVINFGVGVVTIAEGPGVTIVRANSLVMNGQGSSVELVKRSANTWSLVGGAV
jgi:hypothetical protein